MSNNTLDKIKIYNISSNEQKYPEIGDWHSINTSALFGYNEMKELYFKDKVTYEKKYRKKGKFIGLGLNYGGTWKVVQDNTGFSESKSIKLFANYFKNLKVFKKYLDKIVAKAMKVKYVETFLGRRLFLPQLDSDEWWIRNKGKNKIYNSPIQAMGAEMVKLITLKVGEYLERYDIYSWQFNNITKSYHKRIVGINYIYYKKHKKEIEKRFNDAPDGHTKVLVIGKDKEVKFEYQRNLKISMKDIRDFKMFIIW